MYEIYSRSDMSDGLLLSVRIPEEDLDKKALYTIMDDMPAFLVPFRHRFIDGQVEITYMPGSRGRLQYFYGRRNTREYISFWQSVLEPLLDCDDWFMNPFSLVLRAEHLYYDKAAQTVGYLYIPSVKPYSGYDGLKEMASLLSEHCPASDPVLENQVLRAITQDFNPKRFLQALKNSQQPIQYDPPIQAPPFVAADKQPLPEYPIMQEQSVHIPVNIPAPQPVLNDIVINMPKGKHPKAFTAPKAPKRPKALKAPKASKASKSGGLFGGGKKPAFEQEKCAPAMVPPTPHQILGGAALDSVNGFGHPAPAMISAYTPESDDGATVVEDDSPSHGAKLRLAGDPSLPSDIIVDIAVGQLFTIGRRDVSAGMSQSCFEFDGKTKAISRRHAVIERVPDGYIILDLSSRAGTYLNGQKLVSNMALKLDHGSRVSFGNAGANYIWEELCV